VRIAQIEPSQGSARPSPRRAARRNFVARLMTVAIMDRGCYSQLAIRFRSERDAASRNESWLVFPVNYAFCACVRMLETCESPERSRSRSLQRNEIDRAARSFSSLDPPSIQLSQGPLCRKDALDYLDDVIFARAQPLGRTARLRPVRFGRKAREREREREREKRDAVRALKVHKWRNRAVAAVP